MVPSAPTRVEAACVARAHHVSETPTVSLHREANPHNIHLCGQLSLLDEPTGAAFSGLPHPGPSVWGHSTDCRVPRRRPRSARRARWVAERGTSHNGR
jgi:hypothetical protein